MIILVIDVDDPDEMSVVYVQVLGRYGLSSRNRAGRYTRCNARPERPARYVYPSIEFACHRERLFVFVEVIGVDRYSEPNQGTSSHGEPNLQVIREKLPTGTAEPQIS